MPRKTLDELRTNPPRLTEAEAARLAARTDDEIDAAAEADTEHPPTDDDQLARAAFARDVRLAREASALTQPAFADRYHIALSRLRDREQGCFKPDTVAAAYIPIILREPRAVERALSES